MKNQLRFTPESYETKTCTIGERQITYRAYENISYCANPVDPIQKLNIFVPESLAQGESINGYTLTTAPIFMPNTVGGYMAGPSDVPGKDAFGRPNPIFEGLFHGYVVVSAGIRGRNTGKITNEFFVGGTGVNEQASGKMVGRAPALIADMKAAIRYLRHNKDVIPGDTEHIITSGTSAGGALSALTGASGNSPDYLPYLDAIGACDERDDIFAANCYCPIHNLEHADMAYEWLFNGENNYHKFAMKEENGQIIPYFIPGTMTEEQIKLSAELKDAFPSYVNSLKLKDEAGQMLTLDENGHGSFEDLVKKYIMTSAQEHLDHPEKVLNQMPVPESEISRQTSLTILNGKVTDVNLPEYVKTITRMKDTPAFDALNLSSPENEEFGTEAIPAQHFTAFSQKHSACDATMADAGLVKMLNPTRYIGEADTAKHWRIRHGSFDRDTSLAIPVILAVMLKNHGCDVDFHLPWGLPHSGDYDLEELFAWIDHLCK